MPKRKYTATDWVVESALAEHEICIHCNEESCQTYFINKASPEETTIVVRDCQPSSYNKLPNYLLKELKEGELWTNTN